MQLAPHRRHHSLPRVSARSVRRSINVVLYALLGWFYGQVFWLGDIQVSQLWVFGEIDKPYVYRRLVPLLSRALIEIFDLRVDLALVITVALSAVAGVLLAGQLFRELGDPQADLHELVFAGILFLVRIRDATPYDFATIGTFSLCLLLLHRRRFGWYQAAFALACLNRETTFLLIFFFVVHYFWKLEARQYLVHLGLQLGTFGAVRLGMLYLFRDNPGPEAEFHLLRNLGDPWVLVSLGFLAAIAWLLSRRWADTPVFCRQAVLAFVLPTLPLWLLFGRTLELRVFLEVVPLVFWILFKAERSASSSPRGAFPGVA